MAAQIYSYDTIPNFRYTKVIHGIDIHKKRWSVHLRTDICDHRGFSMPPDPEKLFQYVQLHFPDHEVAVAFEIGCCGFWSTEARTANKRLTNVLAERITIGCSGLSAAVPADEQKSTFSIYLQL